MTYEVQRGKMGRETLTIVEIDVEVCSLTYGTAPCTAAVGVTGTDKCYDGRKTCQNLPNYTPITKTFRFVDRQVNDPALAPSYQQLKTVSSAPTRIDPGKGLGIRAVVSVTLQDEAVSDVGWDKYVRDRSYAPKLRGTFWGKFKARYPFYPGGEMRVMTGYLVDGQYDPANFRTRVYVIEGIDGPDSSGSVKITGKDFLKLLDDNRAQCPAVTPGYLLADMELADTTATIEPPGAGDLYYDASGYVVIGEEVMGFTRTGDDFVLTRAQRGTEADEYDAGASVQQAKVWTDAKIQDIMFELITEFGSIDASYIDMAQWDDECDTWLAGYRLSAFIAKPTGVNTLVTELCVSGVNYVWWDEVEQTIPMRVLRPDVFGEATALTDINNIVANSVSVDANPEQRLTQLWVFYGLRNPMADLEDDKNYDNRYVLIDTDAEAGFGDKRVRKVFSRWIPTDLNSLATVVASRLLNQYLNMPEEITFDLDAKDGDVWTGDIATLVSRILQDASGDSVVTKVQVIQAMEKVTGTKFSYIAIRSQFTGRYGFITENDMVDYTDADEEQRATNGFICDNDGIMPDGTPGYQII